MNLEERKEAWTKILGMYETHLNDTATRSHYANYFLEWCDRFMDWLAGNYKVPEKLNMAEKLGSGWYLVELFNWSKPQIVELDDSGDWSHGSKVLRPSDVIQIYEKINLTSQ